MKRWIVTLVTAVGLALVAAPAAQADKPCNAVPELPGECLSDATYAFLLHVEGERDSALASYADSRETVGFLRAENAAVRDQLWQAGQDRQAALAAASAADSERDGALAAVTFFRTRTLVLQAKVHDLRRELRDIR